MESTDFIFDGIKSSDMGQYIVRINGGGVESPFFGGQSIQESQARKKITPYHFGVDRKPIEFTIQISPLDDKWTPERRSKIGRWLIHDTYKPFQSADDLGKIYYTIVTEAPNFELYNNRGFVPFTFRTNSAYAWSPIFIEEYDVSTNPSTVNIIMNNLSNINMNYRPKVEIELIGTTTSVELKNLSNGGKVFKLEGLNRLETIFIDNENEIITSSAEISNAFAGFNRQWLELVYGENLIEVKGRCKIWTKMQFPILQ